ncbi:MAG TPA: FkbM family methyltransferase, partial [Anaerolineales bacterium]|nr:FkbM family methyltransferase [Anaerolineales bacterium]
MDVWSVKETFLDRFYEKYGTELGDGWKIVDIGAGIGEFTLFALLGHPQNIVYAFEPYPRSFDLLSSNLAANGIANAQIFSEAIGAETGTLALDLSSGEPLQIQSLSLDTVLTQGEVL